MVGVRRNHHVLFRAYTSTRHIYNVYKYTGTSLNILQHPFHRQSRTYLNSYAIMFITFVLNGMNSKLNFEHEIINLAKKQVAYDMHVNKEQLIDNEHFY